MRAQDLGELLTAASYRLAVAESVTAGGLASALADTPGSSDWFAGGVVAYQSEIKYRCLGVRRGPVITAEAAQEMALGVCRLLDTDVGIATTGCAGPESMEGQPVGIVWIAVAVEGVASAVQCQLGGDRAQIRNAAINRALVAATRAMRRAHVVGKLAV